MRRLLLAALGTFLFLGIPASLLTAAPKPNPLEAELNRVKNAICAKADVDQDDYRPFVCQARCGCLTPTFVQNAFSCQATGNTFTIESLVAVGRCVGGAVCEASSNQACFPGGFPCLVPGETCQTSCSPFGCVSFCRRPCSSDGDCPNTNVTATLAGVTQPDSPDAVQCDVVGVGAKAINSNDALECLNQVQAVTGTCQ